ncbi:MAG: hypothetical protein K0U93_13025 [Gammaproteobacteria bacterium]|nr:hypothetical protein [Gammaproteobacteria bacterium]
MRSAPQLPNNWFLRCLFAIRCARTGRIGDFALLKADLFGSRPSTAARAKLAPLAGYRPNIDLAKLSTLPVNTFGRAYAQWMQSKKLAPITISPELAGLADQNVLAVRYLSTHDMFHVLTGFDTSLAGEIGVLGFARAQNYAFVHRIALALATVLYPVWRPLKLKEILAAKRKGLKMGHKAVFLLGERLEENFEKDLDAYRKQLHISR